MKRQKTSVSQEDYLKAIGEMLEEDQTPISARLAEELDVTPPAVTAAIKRMTRDDLVRVDRSGRIDLTRKGRSVAERLAVRHQLAELLLTEIIGLPWSKAHDEAERLEHAVSPDFESKLLAKLGKSGACPHGNLSEMESPASRRHRGLFLLSDAAPGAAYAVSGIYERDRRLLEFLEARGIRPGARLRLLERNYDQTLALSTAAGNVSLGRAAAERVWVSPANHGPAR